MNARQQLFNKVVPHAAKMEKSETPWGHCMYRGEGGRKCFIGVGIPDSAYNPDMEDVGWEGVWRAAGLDPAVDDGWGERLQCIHDNNPPEAWERLLREFAKEEGMTWPT